MTGPQPGYKRCPDCAEDVRDQARRCRFCGYSFERGRPLLDALRRPRATMSSDELLASWGVELAAGESLERIGFCRLDGVDGFLVVTARRVLFFTAKAPRCLLEAQLDAVSGAIAAGRLGRARIELRAGARSVVLSGFVSRAELGAVAGCLGVALA